MRSFRVAAVLVAVISLGQGWSACAQVNCQPYWTAAYKCMEHCGPCPNTGGASNNNAAANAAAAEAARAAAEAAAAAERKRQAELAQARIDAENKRHQEEAEDHARFMEDRDAVAGTLRGSAGTAPVGVGESGLRGSSVTPELRGSSTPETTAPKPEPTLARTYIPSGNALIGGTTWITGYNVRNADPALVAKERQMMAQQMKLAGKQYSDGVDFNRYNFVLGIAASTDAFTDLSTRVIFDEFKNGQHSATEQAAYDSLKGRQFGELACHSNGAMVCLAALDNKDIVADHVVLYGPQVTVESLKMWDEMVRSGQVKSVQVYINRNDPVPPASMLAGGGLVGATALSSLAMFKAPTITSAINEISPRLTVQTFSCGNGVPTLACHSMTAYKARVTSMPSSPAQTVPGTKLNGVGVPEPPSPKPQ